MQWNIVKVNIAGEDVPMKLPDCAKPHQPDQLARGTARQPGVVLVGNVGFLGTYDGFLLD